MRRKTINMISAIWTVGLDEKAVDKVSVIWTVELDEKSIDKISVIGAVSVIGIIVIGSDEKKAVNEKGDDRFNER